MLTLDPPGVTLRPELFGDDISMSAVKKGKTRSVMKAKNMQILTSVFILLLVGGGVYLTLDALGVFAGAPVVPPASAPTTVEFLILDQVSGDEVDSDDHDIDIYECDISEMTDDEIADLLYADYTLDTTKNSGDSFTPDFATYLYWIHINGDDIVDRWEQLTPLDLGIATYYVMNETEDISMLAYSSNLTTTVNQTDYREWNIKTFCLDDAGELTDEEGFRSYYDFENDVNVNLVIRVEFNTTAQLSWCADNSNLGASEVAAGEYLYYEYPITVTGESDFQIKFGSTIGTAFEVIEIAFGVGSAADFDELVAQN